MLPLLSLRRRTVGTYGTVITALARAGGVVMGGAKNAPINENANLLRSANDYLNEAATLFDEFLALGYKASLPLQTWCVRLLHCVAMHCAVVGVVLHCSCFCCERCIVFGRYILSFPAMLLNTNP